MIWNLLAEKQDDLGSLLFMGALVVAMVVMMVVSRRSQKKRQDEANKMLDAIQPGHTVKTIGGICGVVVEVCPEDNTFVLETGSEAHGKSYIKFDKQAVYQTNAKVEESKEEAQAPTEEPKADN